MNVDQLVRAGDSPGVAGTVRLARFEALARQVGNTPVVELDPPAGSAARLLVKLEGANPTGSVKDRACVSMLRRMLTAPDWDPSRTILDASSGNMGCSIAYFGRALGLPVHIVSSSKLTPEKRLFIEYFGASVHTVGTFTIEGNGYCREAAEADPGKWYFLDQLHNPANPLAHVVSTGPEIVSQAPRLTAVVGSVGSGGTLLGVGRYLKQVDDQIMIIAVEADRGTRIPGTAALVDGDYRSPFIAEGFDRNTFDVSIRVAEADARAYAHRAAAAGVFGGLQTGAVVCAAYRAVETYRLGGAVVVLSGDSGWKNIKSLSGEGVLTNGRH
jgi:cysteine synthase